MQSHIVTFQIKSEHMKAFMEEMIEHARVSLETEPGCMRYDVLQDTEDPNRCHVFEVFTDEEAFKFHREHAHNLAWRDRVWDWQEVERIRREGDIVFPPDSAWQKSRVA